MSVSVTGWLLVSLLWLLLDVLIVAGLWVADRRRARRAQLDDRHLANGVEWCDVPPVHTHGPTGELECAACDRLDWTGRMPFVIVDGETRRVGG